MSQDEILHKPLPSSPHTARPPWWDDLLRNLGKMPALQYAVAQTKYMTRGGRRTLTAEVLSRYLQVGIHLDGVFYQAGGHEAQAELRAAEGAQLETYIKEMPGDPRGMSAAIKAVYPRAFSANKDQIEGLMATNVIDERSISQETALELYASILRNHGCTVIFPEPGKTRPSYEPLPDDAILSEFMSLPSPEEAGRMDLEFDEDDSMDDDDDDEIRVVKDIDPVS